MIDGVTQLIMMKSDVMNDFETIRVATAYEVDGVRTMEFPYSISGEAKPSIPISRGGSATCARAAAMRISPRRSSATWSSSSVRRACP